MISTVLLFCTLQQAGGGVFVPDWEIPQSEYQGQAVVLPAPDLNSDGRDDWVISFGGNIGKDILTLVSGADGSRIWEVPGAARSILEYVDLDADGRYELLVGSNDDFLRCYDAHSGALLWDGQGIWPTHLHAEGLEYVDIDQDGKLEVLATEAAGEARLNVINTALFSSDGSLIWSTSIGNRDGTDSALRLFDLNQDGTLDVLQSDPGFRVQGGPLNEGLVQAIDGKTGTLLWETRGMRTNALLGAYLDVIDLDGDGVVEVVSRSPGGHVSGMVDAGIAVSLDILTGAPNWIVEGTEANQRLGDVAEFGDLDANGSTDLLLGMPMANGGNGLVRAVDGKSGVDLWSAQDWPRNHENFGRHLAIWQASAGSPAQVVIQSSRLTSAQEKELRGYDFRVGATGQRIAAHLLEIEAPYVIEFELADLDHDQDPEVYFSQPGRGGMIGVVDGSFGLLWKRFEQGVGRFSFLRQKSASGPWLILTQTDQAMNGITDARKVLGINAITGKAVWEYAGVRAGAYMGRDLELVHDVQLDRPVLLASSSARTATVVANEVHVLDPESGEAIASFRDDKSLYSYSDPVLARSADSDQDGQHELLVISSGCWQQFPAKPIRRKLLSMSGGPISISMGGVAKLHLDFGKPCAWYEYEVLVSAHGTGRATETTLDIPLHRDRLLGLSLERKIPGGMMPRSFGVLDAFGKEEVEIRIVPGQFPAAAAGRSLHFCVQARRPWSVWQYCSVPVELNFIP